METDFFYANVCHTCKQFFSDKRAIKRCSRCKLIAYCSVDHQKEHWPEHKVFCTAVRKALKETKRTSVFDVTDRDKSWNCIRTSAMFVVEAFMPRGLYSSERQMFWFPLVCKYCRTFDLPEVFECESCRCYTYCSPDHRTKDFENHSKICKEAKLCFELNKAITVRFMYPEIQMPLLAEPFDLPDNLKQFIELYIGPSLQKRFDEYAMSEMLTCPTTLLYTMEKGRDKLSISDGYIKLHIVGAAILEFILIHQIEVILHWLVNIRTIDISLIGPDSELVKDLDVCEYCSSQKVVKVERYRSLYHDFARTKYYDKPDIVFAFNCGWSENDTKTNSWKDSLQYFVKNVGTLTVFTSYTKREAERDLRLLMEAKPSNVNINILLRSLRNPYRSKRPHRDWENDSIFYINNFITIVETVAKC